MDQEFECCQGFTACRVDHRNPDAVPAASVKPCALSVERVFRKPCLDDPPGLEHQVKTPCSSLPIIFSTSRAPTSVFAISKGAAPPNARLGLISHLRAACSSPSNKSFERAKSLE